MGLDRSEFRVVINHEEQYSIWPRGVDFERGWREEGTVGSLEKCQAYLNEVWTDMRPLSIRSERKGQGGYKIVINHEEQYSIWLVDQKKKGWKDVGKKGPLRALQSYIEEVWTDMRPLSLRGR